MSKAEKMREMQTRITELECKLSQALDMIERYQKRDKPMVQDFLVGRKEAIN